MREIEQMLTREVHRDFYADVPDQFRMQTPSVEDLELLNMLRDVCHFVAKSKGFHDEKRSIPYDVSCLHSEVTELFQAYYENRLQSPCGKHWPTELPKPLKLTAEEEELADILIRVFDYCGAHNIDIARSFGLKYLYNLTRPIRHGGKRGT